LTGVLNKEDLKKGFELAGIDDINQEELDHIFKTLDYNNDGIVTYS